MVCGAISSDVCHVLAFTHNPLMLLRAVIKRQLRVIGWQITVFLVYRHTQLGGEVSCHGRDCVGLSHCTCSGRDSLFVWPQKASLPFIKSYSTTP